AAPDGKYFADDNKTIAFSKESFVRGAQVIKDQFLKCKSTPMASLQYGFNEVHDGLRSGTIAMATFGLYRYRSIQAQGAGDDLAWAPPPGFTADERQTVYGFQLTINSFSKQKEASWQFVKFMTSPAAQAIAAQGGEVVARASAYNDPYLASPQGRDQRAWADLIKARGRQVNYSIIQSTFHQIVADAFQRMVLRNTSPEDAYKKPSPRNNKPLPKRSEARSVWSRIPWADAMSLAGLGTVCIWHDLLPEARDDFHQWHNREHMPERVGIPGFRRGRRYVAVASTPEYFNLYEADSPEVLGGQDYLNRLNSPTEWTRRVVPSFRNVSRSISRVVYTDGVGQGGFMLTQRFDVDEPDCPHVLEALGQRLLPPLCYNKGIAGVHLCLADESISKVETAEKKARADTTQVPTWIILIEGNSSADVGAAGAALSELQPLLSAGGAPILTSVYQ